MPGVPHGQTSELVPETVPLLGGRLLWMRRGAPSAASEAGAEAFNLTFSTAEKEFDPGGSGPIGVLVPVTDPDEIETHPEPVWPETELMYAGYLDDDAQARVRYFDEAAIGPPLPNSPTLAQTRELEYELADRFTIVPLEEADAGQDDVLALWQREGAVPADEAGRRVHEVHLVAMERDQGVVGVSSAYLQRNQQLRMDLWYYRAFVARAHRQSSLAVVLALRGRDLLRERFVSGADTSGAGIIYEVENQGLKAYFNKALWLPLEFTFIGENERGDHVRVHYFPGAKVPAMERQSPKD